MIWYTIKKEEALTRSFVGYHKVLLGIINALKVIFSIKKNFNAIDKW